MNIRPRRGGWGNRVSPHPRPAGAWGNRVSPSPHPVGGFGRALPSQTLLSPCGCGPEGRAPGPPPTGEGVGGRSPHAGDGETGFPHPLTRWEGLGGQSPPRKTLLSPCGCGPEARAPGPPPTGEGVGGRSPHAGGWGNRVSPSPHPVGGFGRAKPSQENPSIPLRMRAGGPRTQVPAHERV